MLVRPQQSRLPRPPMWLQWVLSLTAAAAAAVALVLFVSANDRNYSTAKLLPSAVKRANQENEALTAQDQVPHLVTLTARVRPRGALLQAIRADMRHRIALGEVNGTLQRATCRRSGGGATSPAYSCVATAASVNYLYVGVVHVRGRRLVWCRHDVAPVPGHPVPLDPRCAR